jgi:hypothetical protein
VFRSNEKHKGGVLMKKNKKNSVKNRIKIFYTDPWKFQKNRLAEELEEDKEEETKEPDGDGI